MSNVRTQRGGRKRNHPYDKMLKALDYCLAYCDDNDDCEQCVYHNLKTANTWSKQKNRCPINLISDLKTAIEQQMKPKEAQIDWSKIHID